MNYKDISLFLSFFWAYWQSCVCLSNPVTKQKKYKDRRDKIGSYDPHSKPITEDHDVSILRDLTILLTDR